VYPAEVENVLQEMPEIAEVSVYGREKRRCRTDCVRNACDAGDFQRDLKQFCRQRLREFQIPARINLVESALYGQRFKKNRRGTADS
jgi:long-chain acyl-CoA synthetase